MGLISVVALAAITDIGDSAEVLFSEISTSMGDVVSTSAPTAPTPIGPAATCQTHFEKGASTSGTYPVILNGNPVDVECLIVPADGGWE